MEETILYRPRSLRKTVATTPSLSIPTLCRRMAGNYGYLEDLRPDTISGNGSPADESYSKPFLVLDVISNLAFVFVSVGVMLWTLREKPSTPLRVWVSVYVLQCIFHAGLVCFEFSPRTSSSSYSTSHTSMLKKLNMLNTMVSSLWWVLGVYWICAGGETLLLDSSRLYWLLVSYLALNVCIMIVFTGVICVVSCALLL